MLTRHLPVSPARSATLLALAIGAIILLPAPAAAQTAEVRYQRALAREEAARAEDAPSASTLRAIAVTFENITRRYPRSGYADNALYQAAGLWQIIWERDGTTRDRDYAIKLLRWLRREYPSSSLVRPAGTRITALNRPRPAAVARTTPPPAPAPFPKPPAETTPDPAAATAKTTPVEREAAPPPDAAPPTPTRESATETAAETDTASAAPAASAPRPAAPSDAIVVRGMSHTTLPRGDRLTLELSSEGAYTTERLNAPDELTLTLADAVAAQAIVDAASTIRGSRIRSMRMRQGDAGVQVVVRLDGRPRLSEFPLYGPYRLVLDFESEAAVTAATPGASASAVPPSGDRARPTPGERATPQALPVASKVEPDPPAARGSSARVPAAPAATAVIARVAPDASASGAAHVPTGPEAATEPVDPPSGSQPAPPSPIGGGYSLARQLGLGVSRIVIDPGHGGSDPGASANGVTESSLVLDVALRLEKLLLAQAGFEVVLTRRTNAAVPLARRTAIANEEAADLFLSIHANSSPRRTTAGVETYYLNFSSTPEAESVAARENASSPEAMHALPSLVRAIATNNKLAESRELAGAVQSSLVRRLAPRNKDFRDLGVKQAPFVVLIGAQMPSVLAEIGFLTNRAEAGLIKQNAYKQQIAQALCDAILRYQASLKKSTTVADLSDGR